MKIPIYDHKRACLIQGILSIQTFIGLTVSLSNFTDWAFVTFFSNHKPPATPP